MLIFICGYKGHGKDTLVDTIQHGGFFKYDIFIHNTGTSGTSGVSDASSVIDYIKKAKRIAFADALKNEIKEEYHLDKIPITLAEKEIKNIVDNGKLVSFRDLCIKVALERRKEDPDYWVKKAGKAIAATTDTAVVFTDWRFINEFSYFQNVTTTTAVAGVSIKRITIRFFRATAVIPSNDILSEHELDDIETDYIIIPYNSTIPEKFKNKYKYHSTF